MDFILVINIVHLNQWVLGALHLGNRAMIPFHHIRVHGMVPDQAQGHICLTLTGKRHQPITAAPISKSVQQFPTATLHYARL